MAKLINILLAAIAIFIFIAQLGCSSGRVKPITFTQTSNPDLRFVFADPTTDTMLLRLKAQYPIEDVVKSAKNDQEKLLLALAWVNGQWKHSGSNDARTQNACTILERAGKGEKFRCVEYGIVLKHVMAALGMPARTLGLMTSDVETRKSSAGHVLSEVWLSDQKKWVLADGQFNAVPMLDGKPLNAVELQKAIIDKKNFKFVNSKGELSALERKGYMLFLPAYLYYFNINFDERFINLKDRLTVNGKRGLMLVPIGAKNPTVFQRKYPLDGYIYTNSVSEFYPILK